MKKIMFSMQTYKRDPQTSRDLKELKAILYPPIELRYSRILGLDILRLEKELDSIEISPPPENESLEMKITRLFSARAAELVKNLLSLAAGYLKETVEGYQSDTPGLIINKIGNGQWNITHRRTGMNLGHTCPTRKNAVNKIAQLDGLMDWTVERPLKEGAPDMVWQARKIVFDIGE